MSVPESELDSVAIPSTISYSIPENDQQRKTNGYDETKQTDDEAHTMALDEEPESHEPITAAADMDIDSDIDMQYEGQPGAAEEISQPDVSGVDNRSEVTDPNSLLRQDPTQTPTLKTISESAKETEGASSPTDTSSSRSASGLPPPQPENGSSPGAALMIAANENGNKTNNLKSPPIVGGRSSPTGAAHTTSTESRPVTVPTSISPTHTPTRTPVSPPPSPPTLNPRTQPQNLSPISASARSKSPQPHLLVDTATAANTISRSNTPRAGNRSMDISNIVDAGGTTGAAQGVGLTSPTVEEGQQPTPVSASGSETAGIGVVAEKRASGSPIPETQTQRGPVQALPSQRQQSRAARKDEPVPLRASSSVPSTFAPIAPAPHSHPRQQVVKPHPGPIPLHAVQVQLPRNSSSRAGHPIPSPSISTPTISAGPRISPPTARHPHEMFEARDKEQRERERERDRERTRPQPQPTTQAHPFASSNPYPPEILEHRRREHEVQHSTLPPSHDVTELLARIRELQNDKEHLQSMVSRYEKFFGGFERVVEEGRAIGLFPGMRGSLSSAMLPGNGNNGNGSSSERQSRARTVGAFSLPASGNGGGIALSPIGPDVGFGGERGRTTPGAVYSSSQHQLSYPQQLPPPPPRTSSSSAVSVANPRIRARPPSMEHIANAGRDAGAKRMRIEGKDYMRPIPSPNTLSDSPRHTSTNVHPHQILSPASSRQHHGQTAPSQQPHQPRSSRNPQQPLGVGGGTFGNLQPDKPALSHRVKVEDDRISLATNDEDADGEVDADVMDVDSSVVHYRRPNEREGEEHDLQPLRGRKPRARGSRESSLDSDDMEGLLAKSAEVQPGQDPRTVVRRPGEAAYYGDERLRAAQRGYPQSDSPNMDQPHLHDPRVSGAGAANATRPMYGPGGEVQFQFTTPQFGPPAAKKVYHAKGSGLPIGKSASSGASLGAPVSSSAPATTSGPSSNRGQLDSPEKGAVAEAVLTSSAPAPTGVITSVSANGPASMLIPHGPPPGTPVRTCKQCGMPGRYKDGKCVEKWGPGPAGPGTVCDRCRKKMKRVEKRTTQEALLAQQQVGQNGNASSGMGGMQSVMRVNPYPPVPLQGRRPDYVENYDSTHSPASPYPHQPLKKEAPIITPIHVHHPYSYSHSSAQRERERETQGSNSDLDAEADGEGDAEGEIELALETDRQRGRQPPPRRASQDDPPQRRRKAVSEDQDEDELLDDEILAAAESGSGGRAHRAGSSSSAGA